MLSCKTVLIVPNKAQTLAQPHSYKHTAWMGSLRSGCTGCCQTCKEHGGVNGELALICFLDASQSQLFKSGGFFNIVEAMQALLGSISSLC